MRGGERGRLVASTSFTVGGQERFARVSGDYNDIHLDPIAARKSLAGRQVVHGVHAVLWALDAYLEQRPSTVRSLTALFRKPIFLDENVALEVAEESGERVRLRVKVDEANAATLELELVSHGDLVQDNRLSLDLPGEVNELSLADLVDRTGDVEVPHDRGELHNMFPSLVTAMGAVFPAHLAALSRLVGMICPGRYSMLSSFDLVYDSGGSSNAFDWAVTRVDERVGAVKMAISRGVVVGTVDAFLLQKPALQPTFGELASMVSGGEFADQRALVVGGSRGIGEVTAKLIAAGGGHPVVTWKTGAEDADRVVADIMSGGGRATAIGVEVSDPEGLVAALESMGWLPSHIYYFASPKIFDRRTRLLEPRLLAEYINVYVSGFANVVEACRQAGAQELMAFYPSSVAVADELAALTEYAAAKAAGEVVVRTLASNNSWLRVVVDRLPRMHTDQTASILPVPAADPAPTMLEIIRRMDSPVTETLSDPS